MTFEVFQLFVGVVVLSFTASYAVWSRVRVTLFRETLFAIRDRLWDVAHENCALDDPAYKQARLHLNRCIRVANWMSLSMLLSSMETARQSDTVPLIESDNATMRTAIQLAQTECAKAIATYVMVWRASGWIMLVILGTRKIFQTISDRWVWSDAVERLYRADACANRFAG